MITALPQYPVKYEELWSESNTLITYRETGLVIEYNFNSHLVHPPKVSSPSNKKQSHNELENWISKQDNSDLSETNSSCQLILKMFSSVIACLSTREYCGILLELIAFFVKLTRYKAVDKEAPPRYQIGVLVSGCFVEPLILSPWSDLIAPIFWINTHLHSWCL